MTYNVHGCVGTDRQLEPERIAKVIAAYDPDIVALQELDVARARSGRVDQARRIAEILRMQSHFHPAIKMLEEEYGDAILSRHPLQLVKAGALPSVPRQVIDETRGALWVAMEWQGHTVQVFNTHFGLGREERRAQAEALLGPDWVGAALDRGPVIVCGDFNSLPRRRVHTMLTATLRDAQRTVHRRHQKTFSTLLPFTCLDYILVSDQIVVKSAEVPRSPLIRVASDHFPLLADLEIPPAQESSSPNPEPPPNGSAQKR